MNNLSILRPLAVFAFCAIFHSFSQAQQSGFPEPKIKAGIATIHGKLNAHSSQIPSLTLVISNPVTGDISYLSTKVETDGSFYFEAPIECSTVISAIATSGFGGVFIELSPDEDKKVELGMDDNEKIEIATISGNNYLSNQDKINYVIALDRFSNYKNINVDLICKMTPEEYANYQMDLMKTKIDYAMNDYHFSEPGKIFVSNELHLLNLQVWLLPYKERIEMLCQDKVSVQDSDIQYYKLLKSFDLNNPQYLCNRLFPITMQNLLSVKAFNIPSISDTPIEEWLKNVKETLSDLVGFDKGQFYDLLVANAYAKQFNEKPTPLSDKQKYNIKEYFCNGEIAKILFRKNDEVIKKSK